jgi:5-enolpyruvylshikimate-3-phosphate synthase
MALPELIEIVPLDKPVRAEITVPGSKSITNRALVLAALADGEVTLQGALWSEDTQIMVECLQELGFMVNVEADPDEMCNRTITVYGKGGKIPNGGTVENPLELFVGNAGTAARFLTAMVCLGKGVYRLHGVPRMHERPQAALFKALRELGYRVESENVNDKLPVRIFGGSRRREEADSAQDVRLLTSAATRQCTVTIEESSQFASALLLCAKIGGWQIEVAGENAEESPYVAMTVKLIEVFPNRGGKFQIEPDASSGSYFWAAGAILPKPHSQISESDREHLAMILTKLTTNKLTLPELQRLLKLPSSNSVFQLHLQLPEIAGKVDKNAAEWLMKFRDSHTHVVVSHWPTSNWQIDAEFPKLIWFVSNISRQRHLGDSVMTAIVIRPVLEVPVKFTELGRLRVQETERVVALRTELTKCGAKVIEEDDTLTVYPSKLHGAEIETYNDHRMAMCFAILGLKVPGIKIKNPVCVKKTFPNFFQKLATPPPHGLGATILDAKSGRKLEGSELFAD